MSSTFGTYLSKISETLQSQEKSISSCLIIVTTAFLNHILTKSYFKCPNSSHEIYGWSFMIVPGLLLAMLTLLGSTRLSLALTGACRKDIDVPENARGGKRLRTWKFICWNVGVAMAFAVLAFLSWVIVTLLFSETYTCIKIGPSLKTASKDYLAKKDKCDTRSKLIGLSLLVIGLVLTFIIDFSIKCCYSGLPDKDLESMRKYDMYEALAANEAYLTEMKKAAEANGKEIVKMIIKKCTGGKKSGGLTPAIQDDNEPIIERDVIEQIRLFLAVRYPRLDNPKNTILPYCRPTRLPEHFRPTEVDGHFNVLEHVAEEETEGDLKVAPKEDWVQAVAFMRDNPAFNKDQDIKTAKPRARTISRSNSCIS
eukprot:Seg2766.1 transcript_id=Seg2766.1/GoldUCD/mRNA.D3Y31 product="Calcium homeostasis modulator protein 6" protein_id=Seg2766.1/GoldUCD/D3Y31